MSPPSFFSCLLSPFLPSLPIPSPLARIILANFDFHSASLRIPIQFHDSDMITGHRLEHLINGPAHHTLRHLYFTVNYGQVRLVSAPLSSPFPASPSPLPSNLDASFIYLSISFPRPLFSSPTSNPIYYCSTSHGQTASAGRTATPNRRWIPRTTSSPTSPNASQTNLNGYQHQRRPRRKNTMMGGVLYGHIYT